MARELYLFRGGPEESRREFSDRILAELAGRVLPRDAGPCKVSVTCEDPPALSVIPFRRDTAALVTLEDDGSERGEEGGESRERDAGLRWLPVLSDVEGLAGAYRARCAFPVSYDRDWADGQPTPGAGMLTLFRRRRGIDAATFIRRWHEGHTPLSLRIHPLWNYVRNVVEAAPLEGSPWFDGIVEEHCRRREDLLCPVRFFGGLWRMPVNMVRVYADIKGFIDYSSIETYLVTEIHLRG